MEVLIDKLRATQPHYIRCLKPNQTLEPALWDQEYMAQQLAYSGLLEIAMVRQAGFAHRREFDAFYGYYKVCLPSSRERDLSQTKSGRDRVVGLLADLRLSTSQYLIGHRLVFLRDEAVELLDAERGQHHSRVFFAMMRVSTCIARFARKVRKKLALALQAEADRLALEHPRTRASSGDRTSPPTNGKRLGAAGSSRALLRSLESAKVKAKEIDDEQVRRLSDDAEGEARAEEEASARRLEARRAAVR